jgi:hypothetical protein
MSAFVIENRGDIPEGVDGGGTRMIEAKMPQVSRGSKGSMGSDGVGGCWDGVKVTDAICCGDL